MTIENIHLCNVSSITQEKKKNQPFHAGIQGLSLPSWSCFRAPVGGALIQNLLTSEQLPVALFLVPCSQSPALPL